VLVIYVIFDLVFWDQLYDASINFTKFLRSLPSEIPAGYVPEKKPFREFYGYLFANVMYKWAPAIVAFAIVIHPRKDRGLAYVFLYVYNSTFRLLLMQIYRDRRPNWDLDVSDIKCKCGFGKPSGHASNTAMLYAIIFYEFWWRFPLRLKFRSFFLSLILFYFILVSIMWTRIYYSAHTFSHVIIGHYQAGFFFIIYLLKQEKIESYFKRVLTYSLESLKSFIITFAVFVLTVLIWIVNEVSYATPEENLRTPGRCLKCFSGMEGHGNTLLYALSYVVVPVAITLGIYIKGRGKLEGEREKEI
jgi:membrane-associated phospholipid phosphatase